MSLKTWAGAAMLLATAAVFVAAGVNVGVWSLTWWLIVIPLSFVGYLGGLLFKQGLRQRSTTGHQDLTDA